MIPGREQEFYFRLTKSTLGKVFLTHGALVEVVEVVAPVYGAIALLVTPDKETN